MCRSIVDVHSATAEIRRGKKERKKQDKNISIMSASATQGGHNNNNHHHHHHHNNKSICIVMWDLKLHMCCVMCVQIVDNMISLRAF